MSFDMEGWIEWYYENSQPGSLRRKTRTAQFVESKKKMRNSGMERKSVAAQSSPGRLSTKLTHKPPLCSFQEWYIMLAGAISQGPNVSRGECVVGMLNRQVRNGISWDGQIRDTCIWPWSYCIS